MRLDVAHVVRKTQLQEEGRAFPCLMFDESLRSCPVIGRGGGRGENSSPPPPLLSLPRSEALSGLLFGVVLAWFVFVFFFTILFCSNPFKTAPTFLSINYLEIVWRKFCCRERVKKG